MDYKRRKLRKIKTTTKRMFNSSESWINSNQLDSQFDRKSNKKKLEQIEALTQIGKLPREKE